MFMMKIFNSTIKRYLNWVIPINILNDKLKNPFKKYAHYHLWIKYDKKLS